MPVSTTTQGTPTWRLRTTRTQWLGYLAWLAAACLFLLCWKVISDNTMWVFVEDAGRQGSDLISRMLPPEWTYAHRLWKPMWDTLNIATLGTLLGIAMAFPVAFLAALRTSGWGVVLRAARKATGNAMAIPSTVPRVAIFMVSHIGFQRRWA